MIDNASPSMVQLRESANNYLANNDVFQIMEWLTTELCIHQPDDPMSFIRDLTTKSVATRSAASSKRPRPKVTFVLGGPGCGKGTQCSKIVEEFGHTHLSAGDLLRSERQRPGSEHGSLIEQCITEGKLVPATIIVDLLRAEIERIALSSDSSKSCRFLIDGFPRDHENLRIWKEQMSDNVDVELVLFFECSEEAMRARLLERGKTSGRADDNLDTIVKRFRTFQNESVPVVDELSETDDVRRINAERSVTDVWGDVDTIVRKKCDN